MINEERPTEPTFLGIRSDSRHPLEFEQKAAARPARDFERISFLANGSDPAMAGELVFVDRRVQLLARNDYEFRCRLLSLIVKHPNHFDEIRIDERRNKAICFCCSRVGCSPIQRETSFARIANSRETLKAGQRRQTHPFHELPGIA
jgi:hypothetical protein